MQKIIASPSDPLEHETDLTGQTMHLIFGHDRAHWRNLRYLMTMRSRVFTPQLMLAYRTLGQFERDDHIDLL